MATNMEAETNNDFLEGRGPPWDLERLAVREGRDGPLNLADHEDLYYLEFPEDREDHDSRVLLEDRLHRLRGLAPQGWLVEQPASSRTGHL